MGAKASKGKTIIRRELAARLELLNTGRPNERICSAFIELSDRSGVKSLLVSLDYRSIKHVGAELLHGEADRLGPAREPAIRDRTRARTATFTGVNLGRGRIVEIVHAEHMVRAGANY